MPRRTTAALEVDALASLTEALAYLGVAANVLARESRDGNAAVDASVEVAGQRFDVEVKSVVTAAHGEQIARSGGREAPLLVVADRIAADAKRSLREAGVNYLDRRGELRIVAPPLIIDTVVESRLPIAGGSGGSTRQPGCQGSSDLLPADTEPAPRGPPDRPLHRPSPQRRLQRHDRTARGRPSHLRRRGHDPGSLPRAPRGVETTSRFPGGSSRHRRPGCAAAGARARQTRDLDGLGAHRHPRRRVVGIPIIARGDYPPDFYVPSESSLRASRSLLGDATDPAARACTVAVAPVRLACLHRVDHSQTSGGAVAGRQPHRRRPRHRPGASPRP